MGKIGGSSIGPLEVLCYGPAVRTRPDTSPTIPQSWVNGKIVNMVWTMDADIDDKTINRCH
ncbi:MAG: hypothetical protein V3R25_02895 [Nitrosomonadaceae bacterium]